MTLKPRLLWGGGLVVVVVLVAALALMWKPAIAPISPPPASSFDAQSRLAGARVVATDLGVRVAARAVGAGEAMLSQCGQCSRGRHRD